LAKILVVDDEVAMLRLIELALTGAGHTVYTASGGGEGLELAYSNPPDLAIVDIMMPHINGHEFCRRIRQDPRTERTPILILSARTQQVDREASLAAGATDFMAKPVSPSELVVRVESMLNAIPDLQQDVGRVLACFSLRGGAGVTSLAVNLAVALAFTRRQEVPLIDLTPLGGHVALMLGLSTKQGWSELPDGGSEPTARQLEPYLPRHSSGVRVLASPLKPARATLSAKQLQNLLRTLRQSFSRVVLDLPSVFSELTAAALTNADRILLVMTPEVAAAQSATIALDTMARMGIKYQKVMVVLNQTFAEGALEPRSVQAAINRPLAAVIPYVSSGMVQSINSGNPLLLSQPKSTAASIIAQLAAKATEGW
jgi:pilus assembly protein CpaE